MRIAMRVVFPADGDLDAIPIYLDGGDKRNHVELRNDALLDRRRCQARPGERVSLGSYFNAFPAGYWRRWTIIEEVRLEVRTSGEGSVIIYQSNAKGARQQVAHWAVSGDTTTTYDLPLKAFGDGGFYWFDLVGAGTDGVTLEQADWLVSDHDRERSTVTLGITTFNRTDYCVETLNTIAADADLREILDECVVIDQGTQKVQQADGFAEVAADLGDQLRIIEQANLGGSGGFSRCMYEAVTTDKSPYVLLLDDDIILETESIARLVTFADLCRKPSIVGGHMFDMNNRSTLHTLGEVVDPFLWQPAPPNQDQYLNHEFRRTGLRYAKWMHQRIDVDYNGWWMCLIPTSIIREIGLSLPVFIKWDDCEYGLRAREAGYPTVSLPGACVWHVSWGDKDDLVGWQAYFHARNRLITALMYSPFPRGKKVVSNSYLHDLKHTASMQYYTSTGRVMALEDVLGGPDRLHGILPERLGEIRALAKGFTDAQYSTDVDAFPPTRQRKPRKADPALIQKKDANGDKKPIPMTVLVRKGLTAIVRQTLLPEDSMAKEFPQQRIAHKDSRWYNVARNESAVVSMADGTGASWYKRDRQQARTLASRSSALHGSIAARWPELREQYRDARQRITSLEAWEATFGIRRSGDE